MIRRILSLLLGGVACWALYALYARLLAGTTATVLILGAASGAEGFFAAAVPAVVCCLIVALVLARLPLVKRLWMAIGGIVVTALLCLFALVFLGSGLTAGI